MTGSRLAGALLALASGCAFAQTNTMEEIARYRQMLQDGNPAELLVVRGEELWKTERGPKKVSLEKCDLGLGPGVVKGAYAQMPRYFADADQVMDFEGRLVYCMVTLQGFKREDAVKNPYSGTAQRQTDIESLAAYVVEQSRGMKVDVPQDHPKERAAFDRGKYLFYMRGGPYDFACATCHGVDNQRIRLQDLPNFDKSRTRTACVCARGRRTACRRARCARCSGGSTTASASSAFPSSVFVSQATIDLITFLGVKANGGTMESPSIKR